MALIKCIECGQMVSDRAKACPHCGYPLASSNGGIETTTPQKDIEHEYNYSFDEDKESNNKTLWIILASILALVAIGGVFYLYQIDFFNHETGSSETVDETILVEAAPVADYTVDGVAAELLNCTDEASALNFLDGIQAKAVELLNAGDMDGYFKIINTLRIVWGKNKNAIIAKIPPLAEKMSYYTSVPDALKAGFTEYVSANGGDLVTDEITIENSEQKGSVNNTQLTSQKAQGTYMFEASKQIYKESYETYQLPNGGFGYRSKGYNKPDGYEKWIDYVVVMEDGRVVKISPHGSPVYIGKVQMISQNAFIIVDAPSNSSIGDYCHYYKGDSRNVGSLSSNGLDLFYKPVFDINEKRVYRNRKDYDNRDIQESEYLIFDHVSQIHTSNDTEYKNFK